VVSCTRFARRDARVANKIPRCEAIALPDQPRRDQLGFWVNRCPRPCIAHTGHLLRAGTDILFLLRHEGPNLIALDEPALQVADVFVVIGETRFAGIGR
jgi:hypothetical protein